MSLRARLLAVVCLGAGLAASAANGQVIPLLPPLQGEADDGAQAVRQVSRTVQMWLDDLDSERFAELDDVADQFRQSKARLPGGGWRLRSFYESLDRVPENDAAMQAQIVHLQHWIKAKPESVTARVMMARALHRWAWMARGSGVASTVTDSMAELFFARIKQEQKVLEAAKKLPVMDPAWYSEMMTVALAQGWERPKMDALYREATAFAPDYLYFYREYANYLLPKWEGAPGDATKFAKDEADRAGGDLGNLIYFEVATVVIKRGNGGIPTDQMDWERIKRGAAVMEGRYGQSRNTTNQLAFMAFHYQDRAYGAPLFQEIGERWSPAVWKSRGYFDRARLWASGSSAGPAPGAAGAPPASPESN